MAKKDIFEKFLVPPRAQFKLREYFGVDIMGLNLNDYPVVITGEKFKTYHLFKIKKARLKKRPSSPLARNIKE